MTDSLSFVAIAIMIACLIYPLLKISSGTLSISIGLCAVFIIELITIYHVQVLTPSGIVRVESSRIVNDLAFNPIYLKTGDALYSIFTSIFLHSFSSFVHIIFNILVLIFLGLFIENQIGTHRFLIIFMFSGIIGNIVFGLANFGENVYAIGASGAISGILGAIVILYPYQEFIMFPIPMKMPAWLIALIFLGIQILISFSERNIAWEAHVGGFIAGIIMTIGIKKFSFEERVKPEDKVDIMVFATTSEEKEIAKKIKSESIGDVRTAWIEQLVSTAKCPICSAKIRVYRGRFKCRNGHKFNI